jgi:oligoribonuclease NrnB/cAMP/cGMP phosphodiesterase (DHH superfamily)
MSQNKVIIFSHESDIDGLGSIVLGKIAFDKIDYVLIPGVVDLEKKFREYYEEGKLDDYDSIYITDLSLYNPSLDMVGNNSELSKKVLVFDHHKTAINDGCNKYSFTKVMEQDDTGLKRSGTDLFYEYLKEKGLINGNASLDYFVELTRLEDTWEWKNKGELGQKAHDLAILFNSIGIDEYISKMYSRLINNPDNFELSDDEIKIVETKKKEYLELLKSIWNKAEIFIDKYNNEFAAVFANYEYRNELSEYVKSLNNTIKYLIIIALEKGNYGQKSYRSIKPGFNISKIAEEHGGGGHPEAASVNISKEQKEYALTLKNNRDRLEYLVNNIYSE